ncbi:CCT motif family protein [Hirschfeldia incana]|nr:CCT motif family protein [Hirschfeldia incana]
MFSSDTTTTTDLFYNNLCLNPIDDPSLNFFDNFTPTTHHLLSLSPPLSQLQTLNLSHTNTFPSFESFDAVKTEHPLFNSSVMEDSSSFPNQNLLSSAENSFLSDHMRRVCSTEDLQNLRMDTTGPRSYSSPLGVESSWTTPGNEQSLKVGRYSAEERKEKISKYRAKRTQRNFTKTIKYACRKTLADNRPRVRGRFARNDEVLENPKIASSFTIQEDDDLWNLDGLHEEEEAFMSSFVGCQSQPQRQMQYTATSFW